MKGLLKIMNDKVIENALRSDVTVTAAKAPNRRTWIQIENFNRQDSFICNTLFSLNMKWSNLGNELRIWCPGTGRTF